MGPINFITTPIILFLLLVFAFIIKPFVTDRKTTNYFFPALLAKFVGAISLGLIYQFYYGGGDTIDAYHNGAYQIWLAFLESPVLAFKLIISGSEFDPMTFAYSSRIIAYGDPPTYFIVRIAGFFGLLTLSSYYANALLFAAISFSGSWAMFRFFTQLYGHLTNYLALAILFIPSVVFWGSGILKDTITFASVCWFFYAFGSIFMLGRKSIWNIGIAILSAAIILHVKIYIAFCLFPAAIILIFLQGNSKIKNPILRKLLAPFLFTISIIFSFQAINYLGSINSLYSIEQFSNRARINAEWLAYVSRRQGGSVYTLGNDDFSNQGLIQKFVPAVWVTLFRPYLWEVKNPVMLLSAFENLSIFLFYAFIIYRTGFITTIKKLFNNPVILSFVLYTILFAFAIGVSTYNFGTLVRYKIPILPFFLIAAILLYDKEHKPDYDG